MPRWSIAVFIHDVVDDYGVVEASVSALLWTIPFGILCLVLAQLLRRGGGIRCRAY